VLDQATLDAWLERLQSAELFAFDTETTSLNYLDARIVGVSFAVLPGEAAYVPLAHDYPGAPDQFNREQVSGAVAPTAGRARIIPRWVSISNTTAHVLANHGIHSARYSA
jgi:DNA polymerase-1